MTTKSSKRDLTQHRVLKLSLLNWVPINVLTGGTLAWSHNAHMVELVRQCAELKKQGLCGFMVSSGAIAAGRRESTWLPRTSNSMASKQLLAAVGQVSWFKFGSLCLLSMALKLARCYWLVLISMIASVFWMHVTISALVEHDIIPVVNENDTK